jgi:hypothetical protein
MPSSPGLDERDGDWTVVTPPESQPSPGVRELGWKDAAAEAARRGRTTKGRRALEAPLAEGSGGGPGPRPPRRPRRWPDEEGRAPVEEVV